MEDLNNVLENDTVDLGKEDVVYDTTSDMDSTYEVLEGTEVEPIEVVEPVTGWSWGAFSFNWLWGIGNHCYWPLLVFIPILSFLWMIICGLKGYEWALNSGRFDSVEEFNAVQESWDRAGIAMCIVGIIWWVLYIGFLLVAVATMFVTE